MLNLKIGDWVIRHFMGDEYGKPGEVIEVEGQWVKVYFPDLEDMGGGRWVKIDRLRRAE